MNLIVKTFSPEVEVICPLMGSPLSAGFPSPARDYVEDEIDLNKFLIRHPAATFFVRVEGDSMINAGIFEDDILVVDRSLNAKHNQIVVAALDGELLVKRLDTSGVLWKLCPENSNYPEIEISSDSSFYIWGVVTYTLHSLI